MRLYSDYDDMVAWIRNQEYEPKTGMKNLIIMIFLHYEGECEEENKEFNIEDCQEFVRASGGIEMFDYNTEEDV